MRAALDESCPELGGGIAYVVVATVVLADEATTADALFREFSRSQGASGHSTGTRRATGLKSSWSIASSRLALQSETATLPKERKVAEPTVVRVNDEPKSADGASLRRNPVEAADAVQ